MLFNLKVLVHTLFLSTVTLGAAINTLGYFEVKAQPKGIDVSSHQGNVNWNAVVANGVSFAYIKATEGTGKAAIVCISGGALTPLPFSVQESLLLFPVHRRYKGRSHSRWLPLCPSRSIVRCCPGQLVCLQWRRLEWRWDHPPRCPRHRMYGIIYL